MEALVLGGLLDKILKTPPGGLLYISHSEADGILAARDILNVTGGIEICRGLSTAGKCAFLGRHLEISESHSGWSALTPPNMK